MKITNYIISQMNEIIKNKEIKTVFQPIVSLENGSVFGYEALSRITLKKCIFDIKEAFDIAREMNFLWTFELLCRKNAIKAAAEKPHYAKLFLNLEPDIIKDPSFKSGITVEKLRKNDIDYCDIIFEAAESYAIGDLMIKAVADTLKEHCCEGDFCGHIGGDDFVVITNGDRTENFCEEAFKQFSEKSRKLYSEDDRNRGYIVSRNRSGFVEEFPLATLSAAAITNRDHSFDSIKELYLVIAKTKKLAKQSV